MQGSKSRRRPTSWIVYFRYVSHPATYITTTCRSACSCHSSSLHLAQQACTFACRCYLHRQKRRPKRASHKREKAVTFHCLLHAAAFEQVREAPCLDLDMLYSLARVYKQLLTGMIARAQGPSRSRGSQVCSMDPASRRSKDTGCWCQHLVCQRSLMTARELQPQSWWFAWWTHSCFPYAFVDHPQTTSFVGDDVGKGELGTNQGQPRRLLVRGR